MRSWISMLLFVLAATSQAATVPFDDDGAVANEPGGMDAIQRADLDGDGDPDLIYASSIASRVSWSRNDRTGYAPRATLFSLSDARRIVAADFDLDGRVDLVSASGNGELVLRLGTGAAVNGVPQFDVRPPLATGLTNVTALATGDLNRDGRPDLVAGRSEGFTPLLAFLFLETAGDGFGAAATVPTPTSPAKIAGLGIADIDSDGFNDVVATSNMSGADTNTAQMFIAPRTSASQFGAVVTVFTLTTPTGLTQVRMGDFALADFDLLRGPDAAIIVNAGPNSRIDRRVSPTTGGLSLVLSGDFGNEAERYDALGVGDIDLDGDPDVVFADDSGGFVTHADNGRTSFQPGRALNDGVTVDDAVAVFVGDDDLDGDPDVLVARSGGSVHRARNVRIHGRSFLSPAIAAGSPPGGPLLDGPFEITTRRAARTSQREVLLAETQAGRVHAVNFSAAAPVFSAPIVSNAFGARSLAVLDFDYDGDEDFILANGRIAAATPNQDRFVISRNQPTPTAEVQSCTGALGLGDVDLGELGNTPGLSIGAVYAAEGNDRVAVFASCPSESLASTPVNGVPDGPTSVRIGDLDADGDRDLLVASADGLAWYPNTGNGSFGALNSIGSLNGVRDVALADVNRDGRLDAVFGVSDPASPVHTGIFYLSSTGAGVLDDALTASIGSIRTPGRVVAADADQDGDIDLFVPSSDAATRLPGRTHCGVSLLEQRADGSFEAPLCVDRGGQERPYSRLAVDDLDADGALDVVATSVDDDTFVAWKPGRPHQVRVITTPLVETLVQDRAKETCIASMRAEHLGRAGDSDLRYRFQFGLSNRFDPDIALIVRRDDGDGQPEPAQDPEIGRNPQMRSFDNSWAVTMTARQSFAEGNVQYWLCLGTVAKTTATPPFTVGVGGGDFDDAHAPGLLNARREGSVAVTILSARVFADGLE